MSRLAEWALARRMRRATGAADRFDGFGHLRDRPAFVSSRPPDTESTRDPDADRIDAGRPRGCRVLLVGLILIAAGIAAVSVAIAATFIALARLAGH